MMNGLGHLIILLMLFGSLGSPIPLSAQPIGDTYNLSGINFPNSYGPVSLVFNNTIQPAGGMLVSEGLTAFNGITGGMPVVDVFGNPHSLNSWHRCGNILEFTWDTASGTFISGSIGFGLPSSALSTEIDLGQRARLFGDGIYLYVRNNGAGVHYNIDPTLIADPSALFIGIHPYRPGTEVVYLNLSQTELDSVLSLQGLRLNASFTTEILGPGIGFFELAFASGLIDFTNLIPSLNRLNGFTLGILLANRQAGDVDGDNTVNLTDLALVQGALGTSGANLAEDLNADGTVNRTDVAMLANNFGRTLLCPALPVSAEAESPATNLELQRGTEKAESGIFVSSEELRRFFKLTLRRARKLDQRRNTIRPSYMIPRDHRAVSSKAS